MSDLAAPPGEAAIVPAPPVAAAGAALHLLLDLDAAAAERLRREAPALLRAERRPATRRLRQVFWDTARHHVGRAGFALGIQTAGQRRLQLVRDIRLPPAGGRLLLERTSPLAGEALDVTRLAFLPGVDPSLMSDVQSDMLVPVFGIDLTRTSWRVAQDDTQLVVVLERAAVEAAGGRTELVQLDLALAGGPPEGLYNFARQLLASLPFRLAGADAVQHGYRLAIGGRLAHEEVAADPILAPGMTVRHGLLAIGRAGAASVRRRVGALEDDLGAETIHQARVALRRLRSVMSVFADVLPPFSARQFGHSLGDLARLFGEAREWDVWLEGTVAPLRAALGGADAVLEQLVKSAATERKRAAAVVARAAAGHEFALLSLGLGAWFDAGIWPEPPSEAEAALLDGGLPDFARTLLRKRHRKLVAAGEGFDTASPERLHALRIEAKKLRYAAEFLRSLFPAKPVRRYLAALKAIQDILGTANDAVVARRLVPHVSAHEVAAAARADGLVAGWTAAEATNARRHFARAWADFLDTRRFWKE